MLALDQERLDHGHGLAEHLLVALHDLEDKLDELLVGHECCS